MAVFFRIEHSVIGIFVGQMSDFIVTSENPVIRIPNKDSFFRLFSNEVSLFQRSQQLSCFEREDTSERVFGIIDEVLTRHTQIIAITTVIRDRITS